MPDAWDYSEWKKKEDALRKEANILGEGRREEAVLGMWYSLSEVKKSNSGLWWRPKLGKSET